MGSGPRLTSPAVVPSPLPVAPRDLRHYLAVIRRRFLLVLLPALLLPALSVSVALRQQPRYAASADVLIKRENLASNLTGAQVPYTDAQSIERSMETQARVARVRELAAEVVASAQVLGVKTPEEFLRSSSAEVDPNTDLLILTAEASSASSAEELARIYAQEFSDYRLRLDGAELDALAQSVEQELGRIDTPDGRATPLWEDLQDKRRQIQTLQALQTPSAVMVGAASMADRIQPKPASLGLGGLVLGVVLGFGVAFLAEALETRPKTSIEIADRLGTKLLGRLPAPPEDLVHGIVMLADADSEAAEPFNFLRANLEFALQGMPARSVMVTSGMEGEGKSTTIANLAVALARIGKRILVVDADLRRPTVHRLLGARAEPGIVDVVGGGCALESALVEVEVPTKEEAVALRTPPVTVLPGGRVRPGMVADPGSLLAIIDGVKDRFDLVLVDAPPILLVGDAVALAGGVNALVIVGRLKMVSREILDELRRTLDSGPLRVLGAVCTGASLEDGYGAGYRAPMGRAPAAASVAPTPDPPERPDATVCPPPMRSPASANGSPPARMPLSREEIMAGIFERAGAHWSDRSQAVGEENQAAPDLHQDIDPPSDE